MKLIMNYRWKDQLLFSNPANELDRVNMTLRISYDFGKTWPYTHVIYSGSSAYSSLAVTEKGDIACLFEKDNYQTIALGLVRASEWQFTEDRKLQ
jgi:hypothetical protein